MGGVAYGDQYDDDGWGGRGMIVYDDEDDDDVMMWWRWRGDCDEGGLRGLRRWGVIRIDDSMRWDVF